MAVPHLARLLENDPRPVIRGTAGWALGKIGGDDARLALLKAMERESDTAVLAEVQKGLAMLPEQSASSH